MKLSAVSFCLAVAAIFSGTSALSILLGNDDGFGSAQLRELYRCMKEAGHEVLVVAPVDNQSGQGGRSVFTTSKNLTKASEFDLVPAGSPSLGRDSYDPDIWYYNGTPAACTFVALDHVLPLYYANRTIDLYLGGPNYGSNLGSFLYTLSGTMGGTYAAIGRNIPGIAFSGANSEQRSYTWINATTASGQPDPATIHAQLAFKVVQQLIDGTPSGQRLLPVGYGINVNTPFITSLTNDSCVDPPFIQTRFGGGGFTDIALYNETTGLFRYGNLLADGVNRCINGDCSLPGESPIVDDGCAISVSVFTIDYDAPLGPDQSCVRAALSPLVTYEGGEGKRMRVKARDGLNKLDIELEAPLRHE